MAIRSKKVKQSVIQRLAWPSQGEMPASVARFLMKVRFSDDDLNRINELSSKAQLGNLSGQEQLDLDEYEMVGHFLSIMQIKAKSSLKHRSKAGSN